MRNHSAVQAQAKGKPLVGGLLCRPSPEKEENNPGQRATNAQGRHALLIFLCALGFMTARPARSAVASIQLNVDAREISRRVLHAQLEIPAAPGPLTLVYPKWIPGEHGPTGPITDLVGIKMSARGQTIPWRRDPVETCVFHLDVPAGANSVEVTLDYLLASDPNGFSSAASSSASLGVVSWNTV